jgi:hypothetical protein
MEGTFFGVITWGCSASAWVAKLLNAHPEVFCVHGLGKKARWKLPGSDDFSEEGPEANLVAYCRCLLQRASSYRVIGDVHSLPVRSWPTLCQALAPRLFEGWQMRGAVLVRHPIVRIESACRLDEGHREEGLQRANHRRKYESSRRLAHLGGWHLAPDDYEALTFHWYCRMAAGHILLELASGCPIFRMEELVQKPAAAQRLLDHLSAGQLVFSESLVHSLYGRRVNSHRPAGASNDPGEIFDSWPEWKQQMLARILSGPSLKIYRDLGYDFPPALATADCPSTAAGG